MPHAPSAGHVEPRITAERSVQTESRMFVNYPVLHRGRCTLLSKPPTSGWACCFKVASQHHGHILNMPPIRFLCVFVCVSLNRMSPASTTSWSRCCWYSRISVWAEGWSTWPRTRPWAPSSAALVRGTTDPWENKSIMFHIKHYDYIVLIGKKTSATWAEWDSNIFSNTLQMNMLNSSNCVW